MLALEWYLLFALGSAKTGDASFNRFHPVFLASGHPSVQDLIDDFLPPSHLYHLFSKWRSVPHAISSDTAITCISNKWDICGGRKQAELFG